MPVISKNLWQNLKQETAKNATLSDNLPKREDIELQMSAYKFLVEAADGGFSKQMLI